MKWAVNQRAFQGHESLRAAQAKCGRHERELRTQPLPAWPAPSVLPLRSGGQPETDSQANRGACAELEAKCQEHSFRLSPVRCHCQNLPCEFLILVEELCPQRVD